jgi:hypothetical protein
MITPLLMLELGIPELRTELLKLVSRRVFSFESLSLESELVCDELDLKKLNIVYRYLYEG